MESIIEGGLFNYHFQEDQVDPFSPLSRFKALLEQPAEAIDLSEAALMIAAQEYPGLNEGYYLDRLDAMASDVRLLLADESDPYQIISVINSYLYGTLGFKGNETDYSNPRNSYLNDVLEQRTGIPITISLVYLELTKRLGLPFEGVNLPGHFIIRYFEPASRLLGKLNPGREPYEENPASNHEPILVDPFNGGTILTQEDCTRLVREVYGRPVPLSGVFMRPATPRQFLTRMLSNLKSSYVASEDFEKALKIEEFMIAIQPKDWSEIRDRGALRYRLGQRWRAIYDFQTYLRNQPDASDAEVIRKHIRTLYQEIAERN